MYKFFFVYTYAFNYILEKNMILFELTSLNELILQPKAKQLFYHTNYGHVTQKV